MIFQSLIQIDLVLLSALYRYSQKQKSFSTTTWFVVTVAL